MKKLLLILAVTFSTASYSQLTDANIHQAYQDWRNTPSYALTVWGHISDWDVSNVTNMESLFAEPTINVNINFNDDISGWDVSNVTNMKHMFKRALYFNQDISGWDVSNVTIMQEMFYDAESFNQPIGNWDVSSVTNMSGMFHEALVFNQPIGNWDVSNVTIMNYEFADNINEIIGMFKNARQFNQDISGWDVSKVTNMTGMFKDAYSFNQDISGWDVSNVTDMRYMFYESTFNQDIGDWDVSSVTNMIGMFERTIYFNQDISGWDVSNVTEMRDMFNNASKFNQSLENFDISSVTDMEGMFMNTNNLSVYNFDSTIIGWYNNPNGIQSNVNLGGNIAYCNSRDWLYLLENNFDWYIQTDEDTPNGTYTGFYRDCSTASVEDQNQLDISIYPNPTSDIVFIDGNYSQLKVVIYDILGKQVMKESITNSIDISQLEKGVYILQLSDGAKVTTKRIIKK